MPGGKAGMGEPCRCLLRGRFWTRWKRVGMAPAGSEDGRVIHSRQPLLPWEWATPETWAGGREQSGEPASSSSSSLPASRGSPDHLPDF